MPYEEPAYHSPYGNAPNKKAASELTVFENFRVSMDSVSAGHVIIGKAAANRKEEKQRILKTVADTLGITVEELKERLAKENNLMW